jgi:Rv2525c-like, glycoside hydrolase-like domain
MTAPGARDGANVRRRYFALAVAGGLGSTLALAVAVGSASPGGPARVPASRGATAQQTAPASVEAAAAAKSAAEATVAGNSGADATAPQANVSPASGKGPPRLVQYHGYQVRVPGSWPVYDLAADPARCVLFNVHAVYLGTPGNAQDCPAHAYGRTEALLIQAASAASVPASAFVLPAASAALPLHAALPAATASAAAVSQVIQIEAPGPGVLVTATYGTDEARIRTILASATTTTQAPMATGWKVVTTNTKAVTAKAVTTNTKAVTAKAVTTKAVTGSAVTAKAAAGKPELRAAAAAQLTGMIGSGLGFDTCTVPSTAVMTAWLASPYRLVATYLGGVNWACSYGNFTASWVSRVAAEGWRFMPLWVGRQAPCSAGFGLASIDPSRAAAQGRAEAGSAAAAARAFRFGRGTPVYFDMEGYNTANHACSITVLNFLTGWTRGLHAAGYVSGVYSSASSGIRDLASRYGNSSFARPDEIWIARWNGEPVLADTSVPNSFWANHQRLHQYSGSHTEKWGGGAVEIDTDSADGLVAGLRTAPVLRGPVERATPAELWVAPGAKGTVQLTLHGVPGTAVPVYWQVGTPRGLTVTPNHGHVDLWPVAALSVSLTLAPSRSLAPGRYDLPITVTAGGRPVARTYVLVSVVRAGAKLPAPYPLVLYAADRASLAVAAAITRNLALPSGSVTGSFGHAWAAAADGKHLVLAVGQAAANALYFNPCGWANPAHLRAGFTPFYYLGQPLRRAPGRNYFELSDMRTAAGTAALTIQLTQYALAGTLPDYGSVPAAPVAPTLACLGSPNVR